MISCLALVVSLYSCVAPVYADTTVATPVIGASVQPFAPQRQVIISAFQTTGGPQFIELYNGDTAPINVDSWAINAEFNDAHACTIALSGIILPKKQVLAVQNGSLETAGNAKRFNCGQHETAVLSKFSVYDHGTLIEQITVPNSETQLWQRKGLTATYRSGDFNKDFIAFTSIRTLLDDAWYALPSQPTLAVSEVLISPRGCVPSELTADCYDYVKLKNTGAEPVDLGLYRLRSGFANTAASSTNTAQLTGLLAPGATTRIDHDALGAPISISANDGTVWLEDTYGIITFDLGVPAYIGSDLTSHKGQSWALDAIDNLWKWAIPSPLSAENVFPAPTSPEIVETTSLAPCAPNQYRSLDTNRCRLIETATTALTPCNPNQERNPVTNRCAAVTTASAALTPCKPGQERSADTNRCRAIATVADSTLVPCSTGQERNPETNRCRKIQTTTTAADFAVEPVKQGVKSFVGWWAIGGLAILAAGYATWEWRDEIRRVVGRATMYFTSGR